MIELNIFVIYNLFEDMSVLYHFVLKPIWNFYEVEFHYSDTEFSPFRWCFGLKRHLPKTSLPSRFLNNYFDF